MKRMTANTVIIAGLAIMSVITIIINIYTTPSFPLPYVRYTAEEPSKTVSVTTDSNNMEGFTNEEIEEFQEDAEDELEKNEFNIKDYEKSKKAKKEIMPDFPIDINTATYEELQAIPGIGPKTADSILVFRDLCGGEIENIESLSSIKGIGDKTVEVLKEYLYV